MTETTESSAESSCNKHVLPEIKTPAFNETTSPEPKPQTQPENKPPDIEAKTKKPLVRSKQKGKPGFNDQMFQETSYYFKDGLRWVYPYVFTFTAYAKQRWFGLTVLQLFSKEFHMETMDYYKRAIANGKIRVNGERVTEDQELRNQDVLKSQVHRHEPPVVHVDIEFLQNDDEMVVVNKPASIPVHPCGRYRHNSVVFILGKEHNLHGLHTIHRIDRLTSGVLMFARNVAKAKEIEEQLHKKQNIEKEYLARVLGEFPVGETVVNEPIATASHKIGVCQVSAEGKECTTKFTRLSYNGRSSVVSCRPLQGRMHQIRVHLHWLGHPIVNDPIYNHPTAWGTTPAEKRKQRDDMEDVIMELIRTRKDKSYDEELSTGKPAAVDASAPQVKKRKTDAGAAVNGSVQSEIDITPTTNSESIEQLNTDDSCSAKVDENSESPKSDENGDGGRLSYTSLDIGEQYVDSDCSDCKRTWKQPLLSEMVMYLHSLHYKGPDWEYKTSIPEWATEGWNAD